MTFLQQFLSLLQHERTIRNKAFSFFLVFLQTTMIAASVERLKTNTLIQSQYLHLPRKQKKKKKQPADDPVTFLDIDV